MPADGAGPLNLLSMSVLGGLVGLDGTSVGQFMVSRPLVVGTLTGWLSGEPLLGAAIGVVLEIYLLVSFPTGGSRFPEGATATVVAVGAAGAGAGPEALALGVAVGLVWGHVGGFSITWLRRLNAALVPHERQPPPSARRLMTLHVVTVGADFVRGALVTAVGLWVGVFVVGGMAPIWPLDAAASVGLVLVGASVSLGILLRDFGGFKNHRVRLVVGIALGLLGARFL